MRWIVLILAVMLVTPAWAGEIIYVDDDAALDGDGTSWETAFKFLQDALALALSGDVIHVAQGTYKPDRSLVCPGGSGEREVYFEVPKGVILKGGYVGVLGVDPNKRDTDLYETVLSGDLAGDDVATDPSQFWADEVRLNNSLTIMVISTGSTLDGVIVTGGHAMLYQCMGWGCPDQGPQPHWAAGGIWIDTDDVTVRDCQFYHNFSEQRGGALLVQESDGVLVEDCNFMGNGCNDGGGGLAVGLSGCEVLNCSFIENWSMEGGGLHADSSDIALSDCVFSENRTNYDGGGLCIRWSTALIENLTVTRNTSSRRGGGAAFNSSDVILSMSEFTSNESQYAGAISGGATTLLAKSCLFQGNSAEIYGGGLSTNQMKLISMSSCTVVDNRADYGTFLSVANTSSSVIISNCIIQNDGQEINTFNEDNIDFSICYSVLAESLVNSLNLEQNIGIVDVDPCFVDPGYWDSNSTPNDPNDDFYVAGDCHLKSQAGRWDPNTGTWVCDDVTSPCIDTGDPNSPIMHEPFPNGGRINMGAYGGYC